MSTALLLIDHGSVRKESNMLLEQLASLIQSMRPQLRVHLAHMELAEPTIAQGFANCVKSGAKEIIVFPYMLAQGRHACWDVPRLVNELASQHQDVAVHITEPLGLHQKIAEVVLERASL